LCLLGPIYGLRVAVASLIGGEIGAHFGGQIGQSLGGKWGGVAGSILGGIIGGGIPLRPGVRSFINRLEVDPNRLGTMGGNIRLRPQGSIRYGELDELNRPTGVQATITRDMIGTGTPANKSITPPGWSGNGNTYNEARGHLLGNQLGGSGDDVRNLVTLQQRPANSPVMRDFETQVRRAVENGQVVEYSSTPIYNGSNPVPRGVTLNGQGNGGFNLGGTVLNPPGK
jgi:DNA/RNA non-specific endonuclease